LLSVIIFAVAFFMCACEFFETQINLMDGGFFCFAFPGRLNLQRR
jgi:hypothetical protein